MFDSVIKSFPLTAIIAVSCLALPAKSQAAFNGYLRIPSIPGESQGHGHLNWIELTQWSFQIIDGCPNYDIRARQDASAARLREVASSGEVLATAELEIVIGGGTGSGEVVPRYRIMFSDLQITEFIESGAENEQLSVEFKMLPAMEDGKHFSPDISGKPVETGSFLLDHSDCAGKRRR